VDYEDGRVYIQTDNDVLEREYTPAIILPRFARDFLSLDGLSVTDHPHGLEIRGPLHALIDVQKQVSALTPAYLFIPPERQFLLDSGLSIGTEIVDGMPSLSPPSVDAPASARAYLLRTPRGLAPRIFVENVLFKHRIAADTALIDRTFLSPDALRVLLELNLSPEVIGTGDVLLPATRVRISLPMPVSLKSTDPIFAHRRGGDPLSYSSGDVAPLSDALLLSESYDVVYPVTISLTTRAVIPSAVHSLLRMFHRLFASVLPHSGDIVDIASHTHSTDVVSAYSYMQAIADILLPLASYLASSNALTPLGRESFVSGWQLRQREPKVYSGLYGMNHTCLPALSELEYFLLALSSLPLELPHWWKRQRA